MNTETPAIYQSGQTVAVTGIYEVVGVTTKTKTGEYVLRNLFAGDTFPCLEGREVAWHVLDSAAAQHLDASKFEARVAPQN